MKAVLTLLVLVGVGLVVVYYIGGASTFDPSEQGRQARAALKPGTAFGTACDLTGNPNKFQIINRKVHRMHGQEIVTLVPAPLVKTSRERIEERVAEGSLPYGFLCTFTYSSSVAFTVKYDDTGAVVSVVDAVTRDSLFDR